MRFAGRVCLLAALSILSLSTPGLWLRYRALQGRTSSPDQAGRSYVRLSNHSSAVLYQPPLRNSPHYRLLVLSLSAGAYYKRRSAVRETWLKRLEEWNRNRPNSPLLLHHLFICFTPIRGSAREELLAEARQWGDVIVFREEDRYTQLAAHTLSALDWAHSLFSFDFLLKTDDDSLVNVDQLLGQLDSLDTVEGRGGRVFGGRRYLHRHPETPEQRAWLGKYHNGEDKEYRAFAPGAGYVVGRKLLPLLLEQSNWVDLTSAEDVYMGELVGQLGRNITQLRGIFPIWQEFCESSTERDPDWAIIHWLDPDRMVRFWNRLRSGIGGCHKLDAARAQKQAKNGAYSRN